MGTSDAVRLQIERLVKACIKIARQWTGGHTPGHDAIMELHRALNATTPELRRPGFDEKPNSFTILGKMSENDGDIRMALLPDNLINVRKVKAGGYVTIGVDNACADIIMHMALNEKKYGAFLLVFNRDQYERIKSDLEEPAPEDIGEEDQTNLAPKKMQDAYERAMSGRVMRPPLPMSDWPRDCGSCSLTVKGGNDCMGCPNYRIRWSEPPGDPGKWTALRLYNVTVEAAKVCPNGSEAEGHFVRATAQMDGGFILNCEGCGYTKRFPQEEKKADPVKVAGSVCTRVECDEIRRNESGRD